MSDDLREIFSSQYSASRFRQQFDFTLMLGMELSIASADITKLRGASKREARGLLVNDLVPGGQAETQGILIGDLIVDYSHKVVRRDVVGQVSKIRRSILYANGKNESQIEIHLLRGSKDSDGLVKKVIKLPLR